MAINWIDVKNELPEIDCRNESCVVIVWIGNTWEEAYYDYDSKEWILCDPSLGFKDVSEITHFLYVTKP